MKPFVVTQGNIALIEYAGPNRRACRIVLEDGSTRTTSMTVLRSLELAPGDSLDFRTLAAAESPACYEHALRLVSSRERSTRQVESRLRDAGYPDELARDTVARLVELGLVDDERFARALACTRRGAGYGPRRIRDELFSHGIPRELARHIVADEDSDDVAVARSTLRGVVPTTRTERSRAAARLIRRGFSPEVARRVLDATGPESADEQPFVAE